MAVLTTSPGLDPTNRKKSMHRQSVFLHCDDAVKFGGGLLSLQRLPSHFCRREKGSSTEPKGRQFEDSKHDLALDPYVVTCTLYA